MDAAQANYVAAVAMQQRWQVVTSGGAGPFTPLHALAQQVQQHQVQAGDSVRCQEGGQMRTVGDLIHNLEVDSDSPTATAEQPQPAVENGSSQGGGVAQGPRGQRQKRAKQQLEQEDAIGSDGPAGGLDKNGVGSSFDKLARIRSTVAGFDQVTAAGGCGASASNLLADAAKHGWGLYATEPIEADDFIIEYVGEVVRWQLVDARERMYQ
ncbi:SET domain-containing protein [Haematococcus lacustris]|uniref:SET domain-containing protein n=1 Tax=Haematococcus lacustris TaxID=44745 RepID=A0A699ZGA3_HAELA|nr:SET domain-containing protein [Haematococcus lacustris]